MVCDRLLSRDHCNRSSAQRARQPVELFVESEAVVVGVRSTAQSSGAADEGREGYPGLARLK